MKKKFICAAIGVALVLGGCGGTTSNTSPIEGGSTANNQEQTSVSQVDESTQLEIPEGYVKTNLYLAKSITENKETGEIHSYAYEYDSQARVVSYYEDDELHLRYEYDDRGNLSILYSYYTYETGITKEPVYWTEFKYDDQDRKISECGFKQDGSIDYTNFTEIEYYDGLQVKSQTWYAQEDIFSRYDYTYNDQDECILSNGYINDELKTTYEAEYYENGAGAKYESYYDADYPEDAYTMYYEREELSNGDTKVVTYNAPYKTEDFKIFYENWYHPDGTQFKTVNYDEEGNVAYIREETYSEDGLTLSSMETAEDGTPYYTNCYEYHYDENGNLLLMIFFKEDGSVNHMLNLSYEGYDEFGNYSREVHYNEDGTEGAYTEYEYNEKGWPVSKADYDESGNIMYKRIFEFDEVGNLIKTTITGPDGEISTIDTREYVDIPGQDTYICPGMIEEFY